MKGKKMKLLEDIIITDSIEIQTTPEEVFRFFLKIVDDTSYQAWHPEDHVAFRWIKGEPWQEGSVAYSEEYLHGKLHKFSFLVNKVVANREIELVPLSRFLRIFFPGNKFSIEPREASCVFTASGVMRVGRLARLLARRKLEEGLASVRKHMKEEGENLKRILEKREPHNQAAGAMS
jgi:hypothetical protein